MKRLLVRVQGPKFCCGLVIGRQIPGGDVIVLESAPYLQKSTLRRSWAEVKAKLLAKGYEVLNLGETK